MRGAAANKNSTSENRRLASKALQDKHRLHPPAATLQGDLSEMITTIAGSKSDRLKVQTVAVLPFINMSANRDDEYFCDGLAEDLLNALAKIDSLKVAARRSAFSFKGKSTTLSDVGTTLRVSNIVEGSIRRSGDRVRISVRLINPTDVYLVARATSLP